MKKTKIFAWALTFVLLAGISAGAVSFQADISYVFGKGEWLGQKPEGKGFLIQANAEIFPQVLADGFFLSTNASRLAGAELAEGASYTGQTVAGGAKYRVSADADLDVFLGGGWLSHTIKDDGDSQKGGGIYGKFGFDFQLHPQINLRGDLSYAPRFEFEDEQAPFLNGRVTVSYEVFHDLSLQGSLMHNSMQTDSGKDSGLVYGGGVSIRF